MSDQVAATENEAEVRKSRSNWRGRLRAIYQGSEAVQAYTLLSPTLAVMLFSMCVPFAMMVVLSFWTQIGYDFDTTLSVGNYAKVIDGPVYTQLLLRSLWISATCTFATIFISFVSNIWFHMKAHI